MKVYEKHFLIALAEEKRIYKKLYDEEFPSELESALEKELKQDWIDFAKTGDCEKIDCDVCPFVNKCDNYGICRIHNDERIKELNKEV